MSSWCAVSAGDPHWDGCLQELEQKALEDIYFRAEYVDLYRRPRDRAEAFVFREGADLFFMPMIVREFDFKGQVLSDFESPYGYSGPIATTTSRTFIENAWDSFREYSAENDVFAGFVRFHPLLGNEKFAQTAFLDVEVMRKTVKKTLDKANCDAIGQYRRDAREKVRKAMRSELIIDETDSLEGMLAFAELYRKTMHNVGATGDYFFDDHYFIQLRERLPDAYSLLTASLDGVCVGGVLILKSSRFVHLHLSATDLATRSLGTASLLRHEAIVRNQGIGAVFHFGGGTTNADDDSLLRFKKGFSDETAEFKIGKALLNPSVYEEVCREWEGRNPDLVESHRHIFLRYRGGR